MAQSSSHMLSHLLKMASRLSLIIISANAMMSIIAMLCFDKKFRTNAVNGLFYIVKLFMYTCILFGTFILGAKYNEHKTHVRNATVLQMVTKERLSKSDNKQAEQDNKQAEQDNKQAEQDNKQAEQHTQAEQDNKQAEQHTQTEFLTPKRTTTFPTSPPKMRHRRRTQSFTQTYNSNTRKKLDYDSPNDLW